MKLIQDKNAQVYHIKDDGTCTIIDINTLGTTVKDFRYYQCLIDGIRVNIPPAVLIDDKLYPENMTLDELSKHYVKGITPTYADLQVIMFLKWGVTELPGIADAFSHAVDPTIIARMLLKTNKKSLVSTDLYQTILSDTRHARRFTRVNKSMDAICRALSKEMDKDIPSQHLFALWSKGSPQLLRLLLSADRGGLYIDEKDVDGLEYIDKDVCFENRKIPVDIDDLCFYVATIRNRQGYSRLYNVLEDLRKVQKLSANLKRDRKAREHVSEKILVEPNITAPGRFREETLPNTLKANTPQVTRITKGVELDRLCKELKVKSRGYGGCSPYVYVYVEITPKVRALYQLKEVLEKESLNEATLYTHVVGAWGDNSHIIPKACNHALLEYLLA